MPQTLPIRLRTIAAAATVIASGLIIWNAYQYIIGSSDVDSATIPIITAEVEPFRIVPEDPGGAKIPNKDSHLYNVLKSDNADDLALDGVSLPQENEDIQDLSKTDSREEGFALPNIPEPKTESLFNEVVQLKDKQVIADDPALEEMPVENRTDLKEQLGNVIVEMEMEEAQKPVVEKLTASDVKRDTPPPAKVAVIDEKQGQEEQVVFAGNIPRPMKKPVRVSASVESALTPQKEFSIDRLIAGEGAQKRHYIQLASLRDEVAAKAAYQKIREDFPDLVAGASVFYPQADLGSRGIFTRIQIGPFTGEEARKRCGNYTAAARGGTCLVISR